MRRIYKYQLNSWPGPQALALPAGAQILHVQSQANQPCLWAMVDPNEPHQTRTINVIGTGHLIPENPGAYIGTAMFDQAAPLVFHYFLKPL